MAQLGIVTYNIAKDWDLDTIFKKLEALGYEGVELRTTHAHKVEVNLTKAQREEIRKRFEDSVVQIAGLGSTFEYQATDPDRRPVQHRGDQGIRPAGARHRRTGGEGPAQRHPQGADLDATLRQIGRALHEVGDYAEDFGIQIRVEVHGAVTQELGNFAKILRYADHPNVYACWNSNPTDVKNGSIKDTFALVADRIQEVHLRDLTDESYPWRELFALLKCPEVRRLHPGRDRRKPRSRPGIELFPGTLDRLPTGPVTHQPPRRCAISQTIIGMARASTSVTSITKARGESGK